MDYRRIYDELLDRAADRPTTRTRKGFERHHEPPRSLVGNHDTVYLLTHREHFVAHWLLTKIHATGPAHYKMLNALGAMCGKKKRRCLTGRQYEICRRAASESRQTEEWHNMLSKVHKGNKGRKRSQESRQKMSVAKKGRKLSQETRRNMSEAQKRRHQAEGGRSQHAAMLAAIPVSTGRKTSEATRRKISVALKLLGQSEEYRRKKSEGSKRMWQSAIAPQLRLKIIEANKRRARQSAGLGKK